jgi:hypothetical protein
MSRGLGQVQRRLLAALQAEPSRRFTVEELAALAYPGEEIDCSRLSSARRGLRGLSGSIYRERHGDMGARGWRHVIRLAS